MAGTTKLDMGCVVLLRHEGVLGDMNLCENPAITCAQHPAQWPGLPCAGLGWRVALEGHVCCVHSGRCACPRFQPLKPFFCSSGGQPAPGNILLLWKPTRRMLPSHIREVFWVVY